MIYYLILFTASICLISADEIGDQTALDDYSQAINNFDMSLNNSTTQNQNVLELLQSIQHNSTQSTRNATVSNATKSNIPTLFNTYQYDSPNYQEAKVKELIPSQSPATQLDSSGTNQNIHTKEYSSFDDSQKMYIEQQTEQDSKYLPDSFDLPAPQLIEQQPVYSAAPANDNQINQINTFDYGTKSNRPNRPVQNVLRTPATVTRLHKYSGKGSANSIKMANNQEWNVMQGLDKNQQLQHSGLISVQNNVDSKSGQPNYYQSNIESDNSFNSFDQQVDLTKINKLKVNQQSNYNRPIETTQIITADQQITPFQQQIISNYVPLKTQQTVAQYSAPSLPQPYSHRKPPCTKNRPNYESNRERPFYFGWKQQQQQQQKQQYNYQNQKTNQGANYVQQQSYQVNNYPNKHFGMPNQFDQQFNRIRKCCIVKIIPKSVPNKMNQQFIQSASMPAYYNSLQTGMFGVGVGGFVNKLENKKSKIKNLIKAPFVFVHDMKHKALGMNNNRNPNQFNQHTYYRAPSSNYIQQQNTFSKPYNLEYNY